MVAPPPKSSSRRPLQPTKINNLPPSATNIVNKPNQLIPAADHISLPVLDNDNSNKENVHVPPFNLPISRSSSTPLLIQEPPLDASLADELTAIREKLERLRMDKERNEKVLRERALVLDLHFKQILNTGELQKHLEIEVDRLYRLRQIKLACVRTSMVPSLREKEQEKKTKLDELNQAHIKTEDRADERPLQSAECSSCVCKQKHLV